MVLSSLLWNIYCYIPCCFGTKNSLTSLFVFFVFHIIWADILCHSRHFHALYLLPRSFLYPCIKQICGNLIRYDKFVQTINNWSINTRKNTGIEIPEIDVLSHESYRMEVIACLLSHGYAAIVCNIAKVAFYQKKEPFIIPCNYHCITYKYMINNIYF